MEWQIVQTRSYGKDTQIFDRHHSSDDNYDSPGLIIESGSSFSQCQHETLSKMNSVFLSGDKQAPVHQAHSEEKKTCRSQGSDLHVFLFFFHPLALSSPSPFFLKTTQEEINHEGKTQLHPLAAGHSSYFVWNWLSESRRPARGAGT